MISSITFKPAPIVSPIYRDRQDNRPLTPVKSLYGLFSVRVRDGGVDIMTRGARAQVFLLPAMCRALRAAVGKPIRQNMLEFVAQVLDAHVQQGLRLGLVDRLDGLMQVRVL